MTTALKNVSGIPGGLYYFEQVITTVEQAAFIERFLGLPLRPVIGPGNHPAKRLKASFGFEYLSTLKKPIAAPPIPEPLLALRKKCVACCEAHGIVMQEALNQCSVQMYPPGAGIGKHRDSFHYGETILGVSFGASATMRFRNTNTGNKYDIFLQPGSLLVMQGAARAEWSHEIPGASIKQMRWSVTWRHSKVPYA
jgi:alkylated DNA repair dioxygenase AlkB